MQTKGEGNFQFYILPLAPVERYVAAPVGMTKAVARSHAQRSLW